ncbi:hypothetical protein L218DRAFT_1071421 [Marasmius fiardii PR-910]|nr:hypothetical protein L218DRAFT_1071421 [Marasmius fiardii PR-910]
MSFRNNDNFQVAESIVNNIPGNNNSTTNNYYQCPSRDESGLSMLLKQVAFHALHDSEARYPQPNVLPGTREEILRRLSCWCEDPFKSSRVFWLYGAAGVGKSAIAQALSEKYIKTGQLAAAFFFSRNDASRDKLDPFIATITHQLATSKALSPHLASLIDHIISSIPGILHKNWEIQFQILIAETSAQVDPRSWSQLPRLIIIDGVDECINIKSQKRLLQMIQATTPTLPLDFLIISRPEPHISDVFHSDAFIPRPFHLSLGEFALAAQKDIEEYLHYEFSHIWKKHRHTLLSQSASWPGDVIIQQLVCKATGQFIYATTVIKYIDTGTTPITPMQRLDIILQARVVNFSSPYPDLDLLYSQILHLCINKDRKLQQILRLIVSPFGHYKAPEQWRYFRLHGSPNLAGYTSLWTLEQLLDLAPGEVSVLLSGLHSILDIPESQTENVAVLHASFSDFLLDPHRASIFYVGTRLSDLEWNQQLLACRVRILNRYCIESEHWPTDSHDRTINGIQNVDIGSLNIWRYFGYFASAGVSTSTTGRVIIDINKEIAAALNAFDPHLYLTTLLRWYGFITLFENLTKSKI